VLVTGATGFVGASVLRALARRGHEAIAAVRRSDDAALRGCETVVWDIGEARRPVPGPIGVDAIVHAAQSRNYRAFPADGAEMFRVNVAGAWTLLDYAVETGASRFCMLSSGAVYQPFLGELREEASLAPADFLGATKLAAEILARSYEARLAISVLRLFFPYGPGQRNRLVPHIIERVRRGEPVQLCSDGQGLWIAPTHVEDIAEVVVTAVEEGWTGTTNVGSPQVVSLRQLAELIGEAVGRRPTFETTDRQSVRIAPALDRLKEKFDLGRFTPLERAIQAVAAQQTDA
jgi:nucleoside-diphosphate-sugar epimerase